MNVAVLALDAARRHPGVTAISYGDRAVTYEEFDDRVARLGTALGGLGVVAGDRVGLLMRNSDAFLESLYAILAIGAVVVPINTRSHPKECAYVLEDARCRVLVHDAAFDEIVALSGAESSGVVTIGGAAYEAAIAEAAPAKLPLDRGDDDLAWLFYTSGTTGSPKGAMVTHGNLACMCARFRDEVIDVEPGEAVLHAGPLTHGSGLWSLPLMEAAATHVVPRSASFDPAEIFELIERHRVVDVVFISPTMLRMLLDSPGAGSADCASLRFLGYGGAPIHPDDLDSALERFGPILGNVYGQGECPMTITMLSPSDHARAAAEGSEQLRSVGRRRGGVQVEIVDEDGVTLAAGGVGEICVGGPIVMAGYWEKPDANAETFRHGWYHTGDLGRFDEDGYLFLLDRVKELIISGGSNIYPREVENVLIEDPSVADVAVFGIPDRLWGESVVAAVVAASGATIVESELISRCREHLASYKKPRFIVTLDALPRSPMARS